MSRQNECTLGGGCRPCILWSTLGFVTTLAIFLIWYSAYGSETTISSGHVNDPVRTKGHRSRSTSIGLRNAADVVVHSRPPVQKPRPILKKKPFVEFKNDYSERDGGSPAELKRRVKLRIPGKQVDEPSWTYSLEQLDGVV